MKINLTPILMLLFFMQVHASGTAQTITYSAKDAPITEALTAIKAQTGYVVFGNAALLKNTKPVSIVAVNMPLEDFLRGVLMNQGLGYRISGKDITLIKSERPAPLPAPQQDIKGRVVDETGDPVPGATISVVNTNKVLVADNNGYFTLTGLPDKAVIRITAVGYKPAQASIPVDSKQVLIIRLDRDVSKLDETMVIAYGTTSKRFNTGSVNKVGSADIAAQPVSNPLAALQGRVPGLNISLTNGAPGSTVRVNIRGTNSLTNGSEPLFIVDGVPLASRNAPINQLSTLASLGTPTATSTIANQNGVSPFHLINPAEIESIEILKDADATTIYGSRGANGVVLITTKKGKSGKLSVSGNYYRSLGKITRYTDMMNTQEYVAMRKEAFQNDNATPTASNAYDLLVWDTTSYTNWQKMLLGGTAQVNDASMSVSGGSELTSMYIGAGYRDESTVLPGNDFNRRANFNASISQYSANKKFFVQLQAMYSSTNSRTPSSLRGVDLPPNAPHPFDENGNLNWGPSVSSYENPFASFLRTSDMNNDNLVGNLLASYTILPGLKASVRLGHNALHVREHKITPIASYNPLRTVTGDAQFGTKSIKGWNVEPMLEYKRSTARSSATVLVGASLENNQMNGEYISASGYQVDKLLTSLAAAGSVYASNSFSHYRYAAVFGRLNYIFDQKYILNLSARRDGSSRFGDGNKYSNFGAIGGAWLFSEERFLRSLKPVLSFGKLRVSYGTTGNDQIGDYQYIDTWSPVSNGLGYENQLSFTPQSLYNGNYNWERNRKLELGFEMGLLKDRILATVAYYRNRSDNQLVQYKLPIQTGFPSILQNFPALIENSGWELELSGDVLKTSNFSWNMALNVSLPRNKLVSFPGIETSTYANTYIVGESVNLVRVYQIEGVNPATGVYTITDPNADGRVTTLDRLMVGKTDPKYFGGLFNSLTYKNIRLNFLLEFKQRYDLSLGQLAGYAGSLRNYPRALLDRWQQPEDIARFQRYTQGASTAFTMAGRVMQSNLAYGDLSYMRLRNLEISCDLSPYWKGSKLPRRTAVFMRGQNLFTWSSEKGVDPEMTSNVNGIPPLKVYAFGFQFEL